MNDPSPQVLVVGAGPTGLLLAAELARRDVSCLLIDALDAPQGWDRATVVHERSLEIFEALGIADPLVDAGVKTRGARFHSNGEVVAELSLDRTESRYGYQLGLSEEVTESVLTEYLEAVGGAVTRSTRLVELEPGESSVTATIESDGERRRVVAEWVVGCDGHRSFVREAAGIDFPGTTIEAPWAVFDATVDRWEDDYDLVFPFLDQPPLILTPLPERRWRAYVRPTSDSSDLVAEAEGVLRRYKPAARFTGVENPARFHCHSRVASRYREGRVLLAGDAAHACSPNEGHGMNTGLQDAFNLGWKLALVCRGAAGAGPARHLRDRAAAGRRARRRLRGRGRSRACPHRRRRAGGSRRGDLREALADPELAHHEAAAASEIDRVYPSSRAVAGGDGPSPGPGRLLPDTGQVEPADGDPRPLHELTHRPGHTLVVIGGPDADPDRVAELVAELERHAGSGRGRGRRSEHGSGRRAGRAARRVGGGQARRRGVTVVAVRPDRYIGLRDDRGDPRAVQAYLDALAA